MVIDELVVHNFGIFGGRQTVRLDPPSREQPVILFGGLNGAGKTTLLEALQLALFGKLAPPARDSSGGYDAYLERSIHRTARPKDGASVEVAFRSTGDGAETHYRVRRSWAMKRRNIAETLDVEVNGARDRALADTWPDQVHRFLPPQLASLFLFDGERIESLADPDQSEGFLSVAIDALLGMDLVRQLETDLTALERRKRAQSLSDDARRKLDSENENLNALDEEIRSKKQHAGTLRNQIDNLTRDRDRVDEEYRQQGGALLEQREDLEARRREIDSEIAQDRRALVELASGPLPFALVEGLLGEMLEQADREAEAAREAADLERLGRHRPRLEEKLSATAAGDEAVQALKAYFAELEERTASTSSETAHLGLEEGARASGYRLLESALETERNRAGEIIEELEKRLERRDDLDRQLAAVPEAEAIREVAERRTRILTEFDEAQTALDACDQEIEDLENRRQRQQEQIDRLLKEAASEGLEEERRTRLLDHSAWARKTLGDFRQAAIERNLERVQGLILECYQTLLRKRTLVHGIAIDPERYRMHLHDAEGNEIPPGRLSAGERQLLAVATLWGLARASGRPLPVVVDTPLGRLDGQHREHLITRYFPEASHQMLLLSTDQEIVENYLEQLRPSIGRMYRLEYDDETRSTWIKEGYFEEVAAA